MHRQSKTQKLWIVNVKGKSNSIMFNLDLVLALSRSFLSRVIEYMFLEDIDLLLVQIC